MERSASIKCTIPYWKSIKPFKRGAYRKRACHPIFLYEPLNCSIWSSFMKLKFFKLNKIKIAKSQNRNRFIGLRLNQLVQWIFNWFSHKRLIGHYWPDFGTSSQFYRLNWSGQVDFDNIVIWFKMEVCWTLT